MSAVTSLRKRNIELVEIAQILYVNQSGKTKWEKNSPITEYAYFPFSEK